MKFLGKCPCPRCLVSKDKIYKLGMMSDRRQRNRNARVDDHPRRSLIERARELIFVKGYSVISSGIERIVGITSVAPIRVCTVCYALWTLLTFRSYIRTHFLRNSPSLDLTSTRCLSPTSCTSLSSGCGRQRLHISSEFCMHMVMILYKNSTHGNSFVFSVNSTKIF